MNELIKIKMSGNENEYWPPFLLNALSLQKDFLIEVESEIKLRGLCDYLFFKNDKLSFYSEAFGVMSFDFSELYSYHQKQNYALTREPLYRALGLKGNNQNAIESESEKIIWDTTCGTGKDSLLIFWFLKSLSQKVKLISFERHPVVYLLLLDAKRRFPLDFDIHFGNPSTSKMHLKAPDIIYYDPMYPEKKGSKKSALPRKEMLIFKEVVGEDLDSSFFLDWALKTATSRVIVKRSLKAEAIKEAPTASYLGKSTRYDMYKIF